MNDKALLATAAKAVGDHLWWSEPFNAMLDRNEGNRMWNPLRNDGDALRLAMKLRMCLDFVLGADDVAYWDGDHIGHVGIDIQVADYAEASRRAIVTAAAALASSRVAQQKEMDDHGSN